MVGILNLLWRNKGTQPLLPLFGPCLLWPDGWMDHDGTWYEGKPQPRPHCVASPITALQWLNAGTCKILMGLSDTECCAVRHLSTIPQLCRAISSPLRHVLTIRKNLLSSNISSTCPHNMVNLGPLAAEICCRVWGTPANFNWFCVLAALLHVFQYWASAKLCGDEQRAPPTFGRAAITLGIGPHF